MLGLGFRVQNFGMLGSGCRVFHVGFPYLANGRSANLWPNIFGPF